MTWLPTRACTKRKRVSLLSSIGCALALTLAAGFAEPALAQAQGPRPQAPPQTMTAYDAAFRDMSADLANPEKSFQFARAAVEAGDVRGAIAALERILQINPSLDNIRLELGILYAQTGRPDLGRVLMGEALANPSMPADVRARARASLGQAQTAAKRYSVTGQVYGGAQYDKNPNAAPSEVQVQGFTPAAGGGFQFGAQTLPSSEPAKQQYSAVFSASGEYAYELPGQSGSAVVLDGALFTNRYEDRRDLDAVALSARAGPRLRFPGAGATQIRPFVGANMLELDGERYYKAGAIGVTADHRLGQRASASAFIEAEARTYENSALRPRARDETGTYVSYGAGIRVTPTQRVQVQLDGFGETVNAKGKPASTLLGVALPAAPRYQDRTRIGGRLGLGVLFAPPIGNATRPWQASASFTYRDTKYRQPDPFISPTKKRKEQQSVFAATLDAPISGGFSAVISGQSLENDANLPNFKYRNTSASVGVAYRF